MAAVCLQVLLLEAPIDEQQSHHGCVLDHCLPPALLALSRCCSRLHQAVGPPLQRAEHESAEQLCHHIGSSINTMAAAAAVTWRSGLSRAQCAGTLGRCYDQARVYLLEHRRRRSWTRSWTRRMRTRTRTRTRSKGSLSTGRAFFPKSGAMRRRAVRSADGESGFA